MKALLLGATGWIGKNIMSQRPNWQWTGVSTKDCNLENFKETNNIEGKYDIVIHTAVFYGGLPFNRKHGIEILFKNTVMNVNVCRLVKKIQPRKFIMIGSACLYPPLDNKLLDESMIGGKVFHPSVEYSGLAKLHIYELARSRGVGFEFLVVSNAYGPGEHLSPEKSHIVGSLIGKIKKATNRLEMMGTGAGVRDYIYITDVAEAVCKYAELDHATNSCSNISNSKESTAKQILSTLIKCSGKDLEIVWGDPKDDGVSYKVLDNKKMRNDIGYEPAVRLDQGLQQTWQHFIK